MKEGPAVMLGGKRKSSKEELATLSIWSLRTSVSTYNLLGTSMYM